MNHQKDLFNKKRILLLEDEDALARLYKKKLDEAGYDVRLFKNTDELLASFQTFNPELAFLDHALHGENKSGIDIIPVLKKFNPSMKIIMLSNYSQFQMEQAVKKAGADEYLLKINTPPASLPAYAKKLLG